MKVLIADDDEVILDLLKLELRQQGIEAITASNGQEAWELIMKSPPDLVILDIEMPEMNGLEVLKNMRTTEKTKNIPVLMLTARKKKKDIARSMSLGIIDYVAKPFDLAGLMNRLQEANKKVTQGISHIPAKIILIDDEPEEKVPEELEDKIPAPKIKPETRLLVVESLAINQQFVKLSLEEHGYIVDMAEKENDALNMVRRNHYPIILIDSEVPLLNGYLLCHKIRQIDKENGVSRLIIGMGLERMEESSRWLISGMDYYVPKPVHIKYLTGIIRQQEEKLKERKIP